MRTWTTPKTGTFLPSPKRRYIAKCGAARRSLRAPGLAFCVLVLIAARISPRLSSRLTNRYVRRTPASSASSPLSQNNSHPRAAEISL